MTSPITTRIATTSTSRAMLLAMCAWGAGVGCGEDPDDVGPVSVAQALIAGETAQLLIARREVPAAMVRRFVVDQDLGAPDMATIALVAGAPAIGQDVEITAPGSGRAATIFKGEVVGIEPLYHQGGESAGVVVRAMNRLYRLDGEAKTRVYEEMTDADIVSAIAREHGLSAEAGEGLNIKHDHLYQHNQTDLEFLLVRAAALGFGVWVEDTKLFFAKALTRETVTAACAVSPAAGGTSLLRFHPRLAGATTMGKVTVRGWDPDRKREIVGEASAPVINIGIAGAAARSPAALVLTVDSPLTSIEEASAIAAAKLEEFSMGYLTAEAEVTGHPKIKAGATIRLAGTDARLEGEYLVDAVSHRFDDRQPGYRTLLRLKRADGGLFFLPEIGDEVLVAFANGDPARPFVVGSLWEDGEAPPEERACRPAPPPAPASDR